MIRTLLRRVFGGFGFTLGGRLGGGAGADAGGGDRKDAGVEADGEEPLLLLVREVHELAELGDELLGGGVAALGALDGDLVLAIAEAHDLDVAAVGLAAPPVG